jgi:carboxymethylenebutenolidase
MGVVKSCKPMTSPEIDPTQATSERLNRRAFVGISAGAAIAPAVGVTGQSNAASPAPNVAEDDPDISVQRAELQRPDGAVSAYAAWPKAADAPTPSVVVIMHVWGVDTSIRNVVRRLAKAGYAAVAPDLYARLAAPSGDTATDSTELRQYAQRLDGKQYDGDIAAAAQWPQKRFPNTKVAIMGFCMGGRIAMLAAIDNRGLFSAVAPFYGALTDVDPTAIVIPFYGSYGARDTGIPADGVQTFTALLNVPHDVRIYDNAGHAFFDEARASYVPTAAADAWDRLLRFLHQYLESPAI